MKILYTLLFALLFCGTLDAKDEGFPLSPVVGSWISGEDVVTIHADGQCAYTTLDLETTILAMLCVSEDGKASEIVTTWIDETGVEHVVRTAFGQDGKPVNILATTRLHGEVVRALQEMFPPKKPAPKPAGG